MSEQEYQVALSFAGEQRSYVEEVARHLQEKAIGVFYDGFEKVRLWGTNGAKTASSSGGCGVPPVWRTRIL